MKGSHQFLPAPTILPAFLLLSFHSISYLLPLLCLGLWNMRTGIRSKTHTPKKDEPLISFPLFFLYLIWNPILGTPPPPSFVLGLLFYPPPSLLPKWTHLNEERGGVYTHHHHYYLLSSSLLCGSSFTRSLPLFFYTRYFHPFSSTKPPSHNLSQKRGKRMGKRKKPQKDTHWLTEVSLPPFPATYSPIFECGMVEKNDSLRSSKHNFTLLPLPLPLPYRLSQIDSRRISPAEKTHLQNRKQIFASRISLPPSFGTILLGPKSSTSEAKRSGEREGTHPPLFSRIRFCSAAKPIAYHCVQNNRTRTYYYCVCVLR